MRYLNDYNRNPSYIVGGLRDLFYDELEKRNFKFCSFNTNEYSIEFDFLLCKINNTRFMLHEVISYTFKNCILFIKIGHIRKEKTVKININDQIIKDKIINVLDSIIESKVISLSKYYDLQKKVNSEMNYYKLKFKFENEEIYYKLHGELHNLPDEELIELIELIKENNNLFFVLKNEKVLIPDYDCRKIKSIDLNNIYCSNVYFTPTDEDFIIIAEFILYY